MSNDRSNSASPWGDLETPKKDPPVGSTTTIHFTLDDLIAPALEKELMKRGWSERYAVAKLEPLLRKVAPGESSFDGVAIILERI